MILEWLSYRLSLACPRRFRLSRLATRGGVRSAVVQGVQCSVHACTVSLVDGVQRTSRSPNMHAAGRRDKPTWWIRQQPHHAVLLPGLVWVSTQQGSKYTQILYHETGSNHARDRSNVYVRQIAGLVVVLVDSCIHTQKLNITIKNEVN